MEVFYTFRPCGSPKGAADHKNCDVTNFRFGIWDLGLFFLFPAPLIDSRRHKSKILAALRMLC